MARSFFTGAGFFAAPPSTPEAYAALIAFFGGDQSAADAYLAQLEAYAADGDEAQDLLDAAEAAGDVTTAIAILAGGPPAVVTYDTLADVIAAALPDGSYWRVAWTGDTYEADGAVVGTIVAGDPSWRGVIPWPQIGTTVTTATSALGATRTADGDGRPVLNTAGTDGSLIEIKVGLQLRTPTIYQCNVFLTQNSGPTVGDSVLAAQLARVTDNTLRLWNYLLYNGNWRSGYFQTGGSALDAVVGDGANANQFQTGRKLDLTTTLPSERKIAQPGFFTTGRTPLGGSVSELGTTVGAGNGDFTSSQKWEPILRLRSTGASQVAVLTGLALS
jgi:hypothetical protein